jgi:hypothetical protein
MEHRTRFLQRHRLFEIFGCLTEIVLDEIDRTHVVERFRILLVHLGRPLKVDTGVVQITILQLGQS